MHLPKRLRIPIIVFIAILLPALVIVLARKQVTLSVDGVSQDVITYSVTVRGLLRAAQVPVSEVDLVSPKPGAWLRRDETVTVDHAAQIQIHFDGNMLDVLTAERIPIVILAEAGVGLNPEDSILVDGLPVALDQAIAPGSAHSIQVRRATEITLNDGQQTRSFSSTASTLGQALWEQGIRLYHRDQLNPSSNTSLEGKPIQVNWDPSQELSILLPGKTVHTRSTKTIVGQALAESGVALQGLDYSLPPEDDIIPDSREIQVVRVREEVLLEQVPLPFETIEQGVADLELDSTQIVQTGEYGLTAQRIRVVYEARSGADGWQEVSRQVEDEWVAREPQNRIIGYGTLIVPKTASTADGPIEYYRAVEAFATSYSPCRLGIDGYCNSTTASGATLQRGVVGVIRRWYNAMRGQAVYIPGYGFATIEDIGAGVSGRHWIDLGYSDEDWVQWSQTVTVYFLTPATGNILWTLD